MSSFEILILAAGKGSRMKSKLPKLLKIVKGKTILDRTIQKAKKLKPKKINVLINKDLNEVRTKYKNINFLNQKKQLGTGHALKVFYNKNKEIKNDVVIMMADAPFIKLQDIKKVGDELKKNSIVVLGAKLKNNKSNGVFFFKKNKIQKIKEYKLLKKNERKQLICNTGVFGIKKKYLKLSLNLKKNIKKKEYLITDIVNLAYKKKIKVKLVIASSGIKSFGINTISELKNVNK
jgi:bifunctional UDP-N-acetylglucosamine pyrophosphorylase/glucosamine-1-phosphate N-acetyltransferase